MNPNRRDVLKYIGMAPFAGLVPVATQAPVVLQLTEAQLQYVRSGVRMKTDMRARARFYQQMLSNGTLSMREVRELEGVS